VRDRLKVVFLPEYDATLAERLIPASDVSNQISTAGYEASGTGNMKFRMNGALRYDSRASCRQPRLVHPHWHYHHEPETRVALDLIFPDYFSRNEAGVFAPLRDHLLTRGDYYMHLADLTSYLQADQRLNDFYADGDAWVRKAILNVAGSGKFSSDRTIAEYAAEIWNVNPCPVQ
jgi:starch phosphorylase